MSIYKIDCHDDSYDKCDENYMRYIGWNETQSVKEYFCESTINFISNKISQNLEGVDPKGRKIVVPNDKICHVMSQIYQDRRPKTGDIYSRYNIPDAGPPLNMVNDMVNRVIEQITSLVRNEIEMIANNEKLTVWTTVLGDFNKEGLRSHPIIKILKKFFLIMRIFNK